MSRVRYDVMSLWQMKQRSDPRAIPLLVSHYDYIVSITCSRIFSPTFETREISYEDLISEGSIALIKAIERFDPSRPVKFESYAITLVRGAIKEALRRADPVPRTVRTNQKLHSDAHDEILRRRGRPSVDDMEVAEALGMTYEKYLLFKAETACRHIVSIDDKIDQYATPGDMGETRADMIKCPAPEPSAVVITELERKLLHEAINSLPEKEKAVIWLYYFEGLTFQEIGVRLGGCKESMQKWRNLAIAHLALYFLSPDELSRHSLPRVHFRRFAGQLSMSGTPEAEARVRNLKQKIRKHSQARRALKTDQDEGEERIKRLKSQVECLEGNAKVKIEKQLQLAIACQSSREGSFKAWEEKNSYLTAELAKAKMA